MDKDIIKEILKNQIDLLKIYSAFIIGLITGIVNFMVKYVDNHDKLSLYLIIIGLIFFTFVVIAFIYSFIRIIKLTKSLKKC